MITGLGASPAESPREDRPIPHPAAMPTPTDVLDLLARQDGLITCAQASELGMAPRTLRSRLHTDGWSRAAPQVYLAGGHPWTDTARIRAAGLRAGDRAVVSGAAAAFWHRMLDRAPDEVQLTAGRRTGLRALPCVAVRRRDLATADLVRIRGVWVTDRPLTALETAGAMERGSESSTGPYRST